MATRAPSRANRIAVARPIPLPAPVMKATLPASLGIDLSSAIGNLKTAGRRRFTRRYRSALNSGRECHGRRATVDPALFADAAIDAETAKLNSEMIQML